MPSSSPSAPPKPRPAAPAPARAPRFGVSASQLVATGLAAVVATFAASYLGVAGTVLGAALFSVVTAVSKEVLGRSLTRTGRRVRAVVPVTLSLPRVGPPSTHEGTADEGTADEGTADPSSTEPDETPDPADVPPVLPAMPPTPGATRWRRTALVAGVLFVGVIACVTAIEVFAGRPVSDIVRGESGTGTSLFGGHTVRTKTVPPTTPPPPTVTMTVTPKVVITTPTVTQTAPPKTATTTPSTTETTLPRPTPTPTTPSETPTPTPTRTGSSSPRG